LPGGCRRTRVRLLFSKSGRFQILFGGDVRFLFEQLDGHRRHHGGYSVLIDKLRVAVAAQQDAEIIEPRDDPLELYAVDQEDGQRGLVLATGIEERVLEVLLSVIHGLGPIC
jgi:hypothetical protein